MLQTRGVPTEGFETDEAVLDELLGIAAAYQSSQQQQPGETPPAESAPTTPEPAEEPDDWSIQLDPTWLSYCKRNPETGYYEPLNPQFAPYAQKLNEAVAKQNQNLQRLATSFPAEVEKQVTKRVTEYEKRIQDLEKRLQANEGQSKIDAFWRARQHRIWQQTPQGIQKTPEAQQAETVIQRLRQTGGDIAPDVLMQVFDAVLGPEQQPQAQPPAQAATPDNGQNLQGQAATALGTLKRQSFLEQAVGAQRPTDLSAVPSQTPAANPHRPKTAQQHATELLIEEGLVSPPQ